MAKPSLIKSSLNMDIQDMDIRKMINQEIEKSIQAACIRVQMEHRTASKKKRWKQRQLAKVAKKQVDLSAKLAYIMQKKHNKRIYPLDKLCTAPPKYMIWLLSTGEIETDKNNEAIKSPLCFDLFVESIKSQI